MTAIGFLMIALGMLLGILCGAPRDDEWNRADGVGFAAVIAGTALVSVGIAVWLWSAMP